MKINNSQASNISRVVLIRLNRLDVLNDAFATVNFVLICDHALPVNKNEQNWWSMIYTNNIMKGLKKLQNNSL